LPCVAAIEDDVEKKVLKASEQNRPDVAERRSQWRIWQTSLDPQRLVFIDETWVKTNMTRPRGRALQGERVICHVPHGHWKTTTFLAALRVTGLTAPLVVDGAINGALFKGWVEPQCYQLILQRLHETGASFSVNCLEKAFFSNGAGNALQDQMETK
jgi:hypothetical protein